MTGDGGWRLWEGAKLFLDASTPKTKQKGLPYAWEEIRDKIFKFNVQPVSVVPEQPVFFLRQGHRYCTETGGGEGDSHDRGTKKPTHLGATSIRSEGNM